MSALTGRDVPLFDGFVRDAPPNGLLLIRPTADFELIHSELSPAAAASLPARSVMLAGRRDEMTAMLERLSIVAGVDDHRFFLGDSLEPEEPPAPVGPVTRQPARHPTSVRPIGRWTASTRKETWPSWPSSGSSPSAAR